MKHYKNLMSALGDAMPVCLAWKLAGTDDDYFNARDVFAFALSDEQDEGGLNEGQFYVVSSEGAIGISSGYEYLVRWLFIPLEGQAYDREVFRLKQELENDTHPQSVPGSEQQPQGVAQSDMRVNPMEQANVQPQGVQRSGMQAQGMGQPNAQLQNMQQPDMREKSMGQQESMYQTGEQPRIMPQEGQKRFCRQCGKRLGPNSKFCPGCGTPVRR